MPLTVNGGISQEGLGELPVDRPQHQPRRRARPLVTEDERIQSSKLLQEHRASLWARPPCAQHRREIGAINAAIAVYISRRILATRAAP